MAISEHGEVLGSVTGGCVEPAVIAEAEHVLSGAQARVTSFGIADDEAFEVGLPCGGTVRIFINLMDPATILALEEAAAEERHVATITDLAGPLVGSQRIVEVGALDGDVGRRVSAADNGTVGEGASERLIVVLAPRPQMFVFGAIDFASALATVGSFMGYRVTVCDARATFVTKERFPVADELVVAWPHELITRSEIDERTAICVLTHDEKFDVPALKAALATPAGYIGAMGSRRTTERRAARLRSEGVSEADLARIQAPIGLSIGAKTPEEVAVAIAAQIVDVRRKEAKTARAAA
jgi:xanthine dehydrogenase accessory factor